MLDKSLSYNSLLKDYDSTYDNDPLFFPSQFTYINIPD